MKWQLTWIAPLSVVAIASCAGIHVRHVDAKDTTTGGLRYCRPAPYLKVTRTITKAPEMLEEDSNAAGTITTKVMSATSASTEFDIEVVMLPDPSQTYAVDWSPGLFGGVMPEVTLADGWNLVALKGEVEGGLANGLAAIEDVVSAVSLSTDGRAVPKDASVTRDVFLVPLQLDTSDPSAPRWTIAPVDARAQVVGGMP